MVTADFSGNFTNPENCRENDIGEIISEGKYEDKESFKGQKYKQLNIDVRVNEKELIHSPKITEGKKLVAAWGKETKNWIGKKFICHVINYKTLGQIKQLIEIEPLEEKI